MKLMINFILSFLVTVILIFTESIYMT